MDADDGSAAQDQLSLEELIVEEYLVFLEREAGSINWVWSVLGDLLTGLPERGWPLLREIIRRAPDRHLDYLGAGPLEDLLRDNGAEIIEAIELEAAHSPKLRLALGGLYPHAIARSVRERIVALIPEGAAADLLALEEPNSRSVRIDVAGLPPTLPGSRSADQVARREALLGAFVSTIGAGFLPWTTPARLDVLVSPGPEGERTSSAGHILQAVIETMALDRPRGLVGAGRQSVGLVETQSLIWEGDAGRRYSPNASYRVLAYQLEENELKVLSGH